MKHRLRSASLSKRLTFLVMIALTLACVVLAAATSVAGEQMAYGIYAEQAAAARAGGYELTAEAMVSGAAGATARIKYGVESFVYVICTVAVAGIATYMITENCLQPLVCLRDQVANLSVRDLSSAQDTARPRTGDEIESLSNAFEEMRQRLDGAFETQKRFSASAAHELRTPLAAIQTKLEVFSKHQTHTEEEYRALLDTVGHQTQRLSLLVKDLLDLSCTDEITRWESIDLGPLLEEIAQELEPQARARGMTFQVSGDLSALGGDRLVARAVYNLAENAVRYGGVGGTVWLTAQREGRHASVLVEDDGPGIPLEHREQIFEPFYRVDKSRSRSMGGAGLGLSMSRSILERHGGSLTLEERPGGGARFRILLPSAD